MEKYFYKNKIEPELKLELGENDDLCSICLEKKKLMDIFPADIYVFVMIVLRE